MTQSPIEPPNDPRRSEPPATGPSRPLTFDEMIAVLVAFLSLGSVLFWGLTRGNMNLLGDLAMTNPPVVAPDAPSATGDRLEAEADSGAAGASVAPDPAAPAPELSAREQLAAQAAARRARVAENPRGLWDDVRAGMAGAAAGVAGVAATPDTAIATDRPAESPEQAVAPAVTTAAAPLSAAATATPKDAIAFEDVPDNYWAKDAIDEVVKGGFMTGFPKNIFQPNSPVTRAQALATLATGLELETPNNVQTVLSRYADASAIPAWAKDKTAAATAGSLVVNYPNLNELSPGQPTTRAELSALIYQALVNQGAVEPIESEYLVKP